MRQSKEEQHDRARAQPDRDDRGETALPAARAGKFGRFRPVRVSPGRLLPSAIGCLIYFAPGLG